MFLHYTLIFLYFILHSHPKYRAALKEKLPFFVCGSTEDSSVATKIAETSSTASIT